MAVTFFNAPLSWLPTGFRDPNSFYDAFAKNRTRNVFTPDVLPERSRVRVVRDGKTLSGHQLEACRTWRRLDVTTRRKRYPYR